MGLTTPNIMSTIGAVSQLPTATDPTLAASLNGIPGFDRTVKKTLDQSDFLKLLSTQMSNQDPLNPSGDLSSISQMASFSSAQGTADLVTTMKSFVANQSFNASQNLLGRYVTVQTGTDKMTGAAQTISGSVSRAGYDDNGNSVITVDGNNYDPTKVIGVQLSASGATTAAGA